MSVRLMIWSGLALVGLVAAGLSVLLARLPEAPINSAARPTGPEEMASLSTELRPPKRLQPLVAVVGINDATETTDYLIPTGILRRANIADVEMLATQSGPVKLFPALVVVPDATTSDFDSRHPEGADYVIVPAMSRDDDPTVLAWIQSQAHKGAIIIGICAGAKVVASAGLLNGRHATTHWYYLRELLRRSPSITYVPDRRFVVDRGVATTTGITASVPMMLTLIEAIAGRSKAETVAKELGLAHWDARHDSAVFQLTRSFALTVLGNALSFWNREQLGIKLEPGVDEVSLALVADAWSRTYRSRAMTYAVEGGALLSAGGARIKPDNVAATWSEASDLSVIRDGTPADILDETLRQISARYGGPTASMVAMQLEYAGR